MNISIHTRGVESLKRTDKTETCTSGESNVKVVDLTDLEVTTTENTAVFVGRTTVMSRGRGDDVIDPYLISRNLLNQQAHGRWRAVRIDQISKS